MTEHTRIVFSNEENKIARHARAAPKPCIRPGDLVRILEVFPGNAPQAALDSFKVGHVGTVSSIHATSVFQGQLKGFSAVFFKENTSVGGVWAKLELLSKLAVHDNLVERLVERVKASGHAAPECYWCGGDPGERLLTGTSACCGVSDELAEGASSFYRQRLAGGALDSPGERASVLRYALEQMKRRCDQCGSTEGMPGPRACRVGEQNRVTPHLTTLCITCVQEAHAKLDRKIERLPWRAPEPEPSAAPHWPAQHSTPSWED